MSSHSNPSDLSEYDIIMEKAVRENIGKLTKPNIIHKKQCYSDGKYTSHEKMIIRNAAYPYRVIFKRQWWIGGLHNGGIEDCLFGPSEAYIKYEKRTFFTPLWEYIQDIFD